MLHILYYKSLKITGNSSEGRITMRLKKGMMLVASAVMVIMMMPIIPSHVFMQSKTNGVSQSTQEADEERTASYVENIRDHVAAVSQEVREESIFAGKAVATNEDYLPVVEAPDQSAELVGKLYEYNIADVVERQGQWTRIVSGNVEGYVETEALCFDDEAQSVAMLETELQVTPVGESATVYVSNDLDAAVMGDMTAEDYALPVSVIGDYVKLQLADGAYGYVLKDNVTIDYGFETGLTVAEEEEKEAAAEAARLAAEEEARRAAEEEEAKKAAQEALRQEIISRTKDGTDFTYNPTMSISDEDLWVLACIIDWEAGWEFYEGKLAVANVVLNRVRSSNYPDTVQEVVYAKSQFGGVMSGGEISSRFAERLANGPRTDECMQAAMEALSGVNNVGEFTAFNGSSAIDYSRLSDYMIIGSHCFY
jgi:spore germination cell wall hydrolase CwlJ-like protein